MSTRKATASRCLVSLLVIAAVGAGGLLITHRVADSQKEEYFEQRKVQATTAAATIDYRNIASLSADPSDTGTTAYEELRSQLVRIKQSDSSIRFVYLMKPVGDKLVFLVDAEDPSSLDHSPPGQVYEETGPLDLDAFRGRKDASAFVHGPVEDRWGSWLSATAYIEDPTGAPVALLRTDVGISDALDSFNQTRRLGTIFVVLAMVLLALIAMQWIVWTYNRGKRAVLQRQVEASALRLNEELVRADRMKSDFLQLASHELRSPVHALNVAVQTLDRSASDRLSEDEKALVRIAANGSARLADLVDNLLDITRIESGDYSIRPAPVDAAELVNRTIQLFTPLAKEKNIGLTAALPDGPVDAVLDPQTILRVLENLVSNAVKFTDFGGVVVELKAVGGKLVFGVRDTGTGIPDSFKEELFKKFSRLDRPSRQGSRGAGMGLALCRNVLEAQGGRIWFESREGTGTTFRFEVNRYQEAADDEGEPAAP